MPLAVLAYDDVPPSLNTIAGKHWRRYHTAKKKWQSLLEGCLLAERVPRRLEAVRAEATLTFTVARERDEGNMRFILEKALGDALVNGGWLSADSRDHFTFGSVDFQHGDMKHTCITIEYH